MDSISKVAEYLIKNAKSLAAEIITPLIDKLEMELSKEERQQVITMHAEFIAFLGEAITSNEDNKMAEGLIEWSKKNGELQAKSFANISASIKPYADNRLVFIQHITKITMEHGLSMEEVVKVINKVNYMLDISMTESILAYEHFKDKMIKQAQEEMNELSAPIVPIQDGIAVLPLIGSIDTTRAKYLLEKAVPKIAELKIQCLIIDFSGILIIDTAVANHIFTIHDVLRLLGINTIATGIRPELAQTVVSGGIDFSSIKAYATVSQAIENSK